MGERSIGMPSHHGYYVDGCQPGEMGYTVVDLPMTSKKPIARVNAVQWAFSHPVGSKARVWRADPGYPRLVYELERLEQGVGLTFFVPKRFDSKASNILR